MTTPAITTDYETGGPDVKNVIGPTDDITIHGNDSEKRTSEDIAITTAADVDALTYGDEEDGRLPTEEERNTLRLVSGPIPWAAFVICLVEFAERASYYGCSGVFTNFVQRPLPVGGNGAGAPPAGTQETAGALGLGLIAATGVVKTFQFLAYGLPIMGGILADTKWGKFKTICIGTAVGAVAHILMTISAIPSLLSSGKAVAPFIISVITLALATGFIKPCIAPIIGDQSPVQTQSIKTLKSGEKVIVDPGTTIQSMLMIYYWAVNVGAFMSVATSYSEKRIGFWLAYLVPGIVYIIMPIALVIVYKRLIKLPPQGSVILESINVFRTIISRAGVRGLIKGGESWDMARPSNITASGGLPNKPSGWVTWDDDFIDEIKRTIKACRLFLFIPIFAMADGGLDTITANQGGSMTTNGAPNDLLGNFNSLTIIIAVPILNFGIYPWLRRIGINFSPIKRVVLGFIVAALAMLVGAILQWQVYETSPCGWHATECTVGTGVSPITIWTQIPLYSLPALAEILINVTTYEIAYTRAPQRMKGLVFSIVLAMNALSSALTLIVSPSFVDPNLIWPFVGIGGANLLSAGLVWIFFRRMDDDEASLGLIGKNRVIEGIKGPGYENNSENK